MEQPPDRGHPSAVSGAPHPTEPAETALRNAALEVDRLLSEVGRPIAVLVADSEQARSDGGKLTAHHDRLHVLVDYHPSDVIIMALAPVTAPAEGEQLARRLCQGQPTTSVSVATSVESDTGESLISAALATYYQARQFHLDGVSVCGDDERSWTMEQLSQQQEW